MKTVLISVVTTIIVMKLYEETFIKNVKSELDNHLDQYL